MRVSIHYVDGSAADGDAKDWPALRAEGVDEVTIDGIRIAGHSLYWLRRVEQGWEAGAASFYPNPLFEVFIPDEGPQQERHPAHVPDLNHEDVKLGWWWRG